MKRKGRYAGPNAQKVLLLLLGGLALTISRRGPFRILDELESEWNNIERRALQRAIESLYEAKLLDEKESKDGSTTLILSDRGKKKALTYHIQKIKIPKMKKWDGKWRIVFFDIPEIYRRARESLSRSLIQAGFYPLQKSVYIHPFQCSDELDFIIEFWGVREYVRIAEADVIDNELHLKDHFNLS